MTAITRDIYNDKMITGPHDAGSWKSKLYRYEDEIRIAEMLKLFESYENFYRGYDFGTEVKRINMDHVAFRIFEDYTTERGFTGVSNDCTYNKETGYGFKDIDGIGLVIAPPVRLADKYLDNNRRDAAVEIGIDKFKGYKNALYEDYVYNGNKPASFLIDVENGEYEITFIMADQTGNAKCHGPMSISVGETVFSNIRTYKWE